MNRRAFFGLLTAAAFAKPAATRIVKVPRQYGLSTLPSQVVGRSFEMVVIDDPATFKIDAAERIERYLQHQFNKAYVEHEMRMLFYGDPYHKGDLERVGIKS